MSGKSFFGVIGLVICSILAACTPSPVPPPNITTIVFLTDLTNYYRPLAAKFHRENPDIVVQVRDIHTLMPDPTKNWNRQVAAAADVVPIGWNGIELYDALRGKLLYNLRPFLDRDPELAASFVSTALDCLAWNGGVYGLPQTFSVPLMVYNRSLLDAHGVPYPHDGWTWEEWLLTAQVLTAQEQFGFIDLDGFTYLLPLAWMAQHDSDVLVPGTDIPEANLGATIVFEALEWYVSLSQQHRIAPENPNDVDRSALVRQNRAAMWVQALPMNVTLNPNSAQVQGVAGTVAQLPQGQRLAYSMLVEGYGIGAGTQHAEAAWRWLAWMSQQPLPAGMQRWSALQKVLDGDTLAQENNVTEEAVQAVRFAVDQAVPVQLEYGALEPVFTELPHVYDGELTVLQLLSQAAQAQNPSATPGAAAVDTPAPTHAPASTTIVFVPNRDQRGAFEKNAYEALAEAFRRQNPDIQVQIKTFAGFVSLDDIARQSDVFLGDRYVPLADAHRAWVQDLEPFIQVAPDFNAADLMPVEFVILPDYQGAIRTWGIPISFDTIGIFYDRPQFDAAGLPTPSAEWTWDDFRLLASQLTFDREAIRHYGYAGRADAVDLGLFLHSRGITWMEGMPEAQDEAWLSELKQALRWWIALSQNDGSMPPLASSTDTLIARRQAAMWADLLGNRQRTQYPAYHTGTEASELGIAPLPRGTRPVAAIQYHIAYISAQAKDPSACWKWVRFMSEQLPPGALAPARRSLLRSDAFARQVGGEMQAVYVQAAQIAAQGVGSTADVWPSRFLVAFLQAYDSSQDVDLALAEALGQ